MVVRALLPIYPLPRLESAAHRGGVRRCVRPSEVDSTFDAGHVGKQVKHLARGRRAIAAHGPRVVHPGVGGPTFKVIVHAGVNPLHLGQGERYPVIL